MFYENSKKLKNIKYKKFNCSPFSKGLNLLKSENLLSINESTLTFNYNFNDGSLKDGLGINYSPIRFLGNDYTEKKELVIPDGEVFDSFWLFNCWDVSNANNIILIAYTKSGNFYYHYLHNLGNVFTKCGNLNFKQRPIVSPCIVDGKDYLVLISDKDGMYTWNLSASEGKKIETNEKINSICYIYNRLFVTTSNERDSVFYTNTANPTEFSTTSENIKSIVFEDGLGQVKKLIAFKGHLYVFREFSIVKVVYDFDKDAFKTTQIYAGNSYIYENTISICGDKIVYLAIDGLYVFDGNRSKKIDIGFDKLLKNVANNSAISGFVEGNYYLACKLDFDDGEVIGSESLPLSKNNSLIKLNVDTKEYSILRGIQIDSISVLNDRYDTNVFLSYIISYNNGWKFGNIDMSGTINGIATYKVWKTPFFDFGDENNYKLIKDMTIECKSNCKIKIEYDGKEKILNILGESGVQKIPIYLKAKKMSLTFISEVNNVKIINPILNVGFLN